MSEAIGISAIATHEPPWTIGNEWFGGMLSRKFVQHTGIESRRISVDDEVAMAIRAVENLRVETGCDLSRCVAVVFVASSLVPGLIAKRLVDGEPPAHHGAGSTGRQFVKRLGIPSVPVYSLNWGCSGYTKALSIVRRFIAPWVHLEDDQFILVVTTNRTSNILDFGCKQTAAVFGDFAQATLLAAETSQKHPVHFALLFAAAENRPVDRVFFNFHMQENVLVPTPDGGRRALARRLVFSLDMMGIGDAAPRAMADATAKAMRLARIRPEQVDFVVPHQAGAGIVRLAAMKLEEFGIRAEVINGLTRGTANISSSSIPYAIRQTWQRLDGIIVCPAAGVGNPGQATVSQGCVILRATELHHRICVATGQSSAHHASEPSLVPSV